MYTLFDNKGWEALFHGALAGALVLVLNAIGHYVFDAPEIPFAYAIALAFALLVIAIRSFLHPPDGSHHGV